MMDESQNDSFTSSVKIPVDPEPTSLRFALLLIFIASSVAGYVLISVLFSLGTCSLLGLFGALVVGALTMQVAERLLKPRWKSNRFVQLSPHSFDLVSGDKAVKLIDPGEEFDVIMWHFEIQRRTRAPKGWYVVSMALEQDGIYLPVYTLASPEAFQEMKLSEHFTRLQGKKELDSGNLRLAGQQRRLLKAEGARNMEGFEMLKEDFERFVGWLQLHFPHWMPTT